ncbi:amidohydrolase family protein [Streptomyces sp. NPDC004752]
MSAAARKAAAEGRSAHFGYSASWAVARMQVRSGVAPRGEFEDLQRHAGTHATSDPSRRGLHVTDLTYAATGERIGDSEQLDRIRRADPGGLVLVGSLHEDVPDDMGQLLAAVSFPAGLIASDAMPLTGTQPGTEETWPPRADHMTHPRTAGTFAKAIRLLHRRGGTDLMTVLERATILPARLLEASVPAMRRKGRLQVGCDADIVVLDPLTVTDLATYRDTTRPAAGIVHVVVDGESVIDDGVLHLDRRSGSLIRGLART